MATYLRITERQSLTLIRLFRRGDLINTTIGDLPHRLNITIDAKHPVALDYVKKCRNHFLTDAKTITMLISLKELGFSGLVMYWACYPELIKVKMSPAGLDTVADNKWLHVMDGYYPTIVCQTKEEADLFKAMDAAVYSPNIQPQLENLLIRLDELKVHETVLSTLIHRHLEVLESRINRS